MGFIDTVRKAAALDKVNADAVNNDRQALNEALKDREIMKEGLASMLRERDENKLAMADTLVKGDDNMTFATANNPVSRRLLGDDTIMQILSAKYQRN